MSRAYRITVRESTNREIKGSDEICTDLEILEILPPEQMAEILKKHLKEKGYTEQPDGTMVRQDGGATITVDPKTCEVSVKSDVKEEIALEARREAFGYDDAGPSQRDIRERVQQQLKDDIEKKAAQETERLQGRATEALEKKLCELQPELSEVVNKVTREALKTKAQQLGTVTEIAEDEQSGNLTIKIEV